MGSNLEVQDTPERGDALIEWNEALDSSDWRVQLLRELADSAGVVLYDVKFPRGRSGALQVMIALSSSGPSEVGHDECGRLARLILDHERVEELLPGSATLEVSSPGINRDLRCLSHLQGAIGERIRVVARAFRPVEPHGDRDEEGHSTGKQYSGVVRGILQSVNAKSLVVLDESRSSPVVVDLPDVKEARVDFAFEESSSAGAGNRQLKS